MVEPQYPEAARVENIQGTVQVTLCFGVDGKVISANGMGASPLLDKAAEQNAKQLIFGPLPARGEYPRCHTMDYVFKLEGKPTLGVVLLNTTVRTELPDRVEIIGRPFQSDYPLPEGAVPSTTPRAKPR